MILALNKLYFRPVNSILIHSTPLPFNESISVYRWWITNSLASTKKILARVNGSLAITLICHHLALLDAVQAKSQRVLRRLLRSFVLEFFEIEFARLAVHFVISSRYRVEGMEELRPYNKGVPELRVQLCERIVCSGIRKLTSIRMC